MEQAESRYVWYLLAACCLGAALRLYDLAAESFWLDEMSTVLRMSWSWPEMFQGASTESMMPLYYMLQKQWTRISGIGEFGFRLSSVLYGTLSIIAIFGLISEAFNRRIGMTAAFICAVHPYTVYYSREARPYSLFFLLSIVSYFFFFRVIRFGSVASSTGYIVSTTLLMYTHIYSSFLILGQALLACLYFCIPQIAGISLRFSPLIKAGIVTAIGGIPLLLRLPGFFTSVGQSRSGFGWIRTPSWGEFLTTPSQYWLQFSMGQFSCLLIGLLLIAGFRRYSEFIRGLSFAFAVLCSCLLLPWLFSVLVVPLLLLRYTVAAIVGIVALLAVVVTESRSMLIRGALVLPLIIPLPDLLTMRHKDLWREAGEFLNLKVRPGDIVVVEYDFLKPTLQYYMAPELHKLLVTREEAMAILPKLLKTAHIWGVESYVVSRRQPFLDSAGEVNTSYEDLGEVGKIFKIEGSPYHLTRDPIYLSLTRLTP